jgi:hypothetical protein
MVPGGDCPHRRLEGRDSLLALAQVELRLVGRAAVYGQQQARRALIHMMARVRDRARGFHVRAERPVVVRLGERRDEHHELRREDERAAEAPEPAPEAGRRSGGSGHHRDDTTDTTVPSTSL